MLLDNRQRTAQHVDVFQIFIEQCPSIGWLLLANIPFPFCFYWEVLGDWRWKQMQSECAFFLMSL